MENTLNIVFIGSDIEANYVASLLKENNIECVLHNSLTQSIAAGWVNGTTSSSTELSVNKEDTEKAIQIIDKYLNENIHHEFHE
ncbi:MAG: DUF2007 domain-containing protein [Bacteroidales bacterium]|nr:DUF2007 domain-containing protein [Bacteroidales bacterium]